MLRGRLQLVHIVDSREYVRNNCFQSQLLSHLLDQDPAYADLTLSQIRAGALCPPCDVVLSSLRLRTLDRELQAVKRALNERQLWIYDQDPWESFIDSGACKGAYERISATLNVAGFIVTSKWWANFVRERGMPCKFARMWPSRAHCDSEPPWSSRPIEVGFKGTLHPNRRMSIERLTELGVHVSVLSPSSFGSFLHDLSLMKFFFHDEPSGGWSIDGVRIERNCVWIKEVEAMARGCLAIRTRDSESEAYCSELPASRIVSSLDDVVHVIESARRDPAGAERDSQVAVRLIKEMPLESQWINLQELRHSTGSGQCL